MAVANVQSVTSGTVNAVSAVSKTISPAQPTSGNFICLWVVTQDPTGIAISGMTGWTLLTSKTAGTGAHQAFYYQIATGGMGTSVTVTTTNVNKWGLWFGEYSGVDTSNPIDGSAHDYDAGTQPWAPPVLPVYSGGAAIYCFGTGNFGSIGTANVPNTPVATSDESVNLRQDVFSWRNGSDTRQIAGWIYDNLAPDNHSKDCEVLVTQTSETLRSGGATIVLRASGASLNPLTVAPATGSGALVQSKNSNWTAVASHAPTLTNNTVVGNLLVVVLCFQNNGSSVTTGATGWTRFGSHITSASSVTEGLEVWYKICTSTGDKTPGSFTFAGSSSGGSGMYEFSGCSVADPTINGLTPVSHPYERLISVNTLAATATTGPRSRTLPSSDTLEMCMALGQVASGGNLTNLPTAADTTWTSLGVVPTNGTRVVGLAAYKMSKGAGELFVRCDHGANGAGAVWQSGGVYSWSFEMAPGGNDHWGWVEDAASDGWALAA